MSQENVVEKIKALLRLADDQKNTPEGELAAKFAEKIMRQNAIDHSMLEEKEIIVDFPVEVGRSNWLRNLLNIVSNFCSCKAWVITGTKTMHVAGYGSDLEICAYLYDLIRGQIERECQTYVRLHPVGGKGIANDFKMSAVTGVSEKLRAIKRAGQSTDSTGTALVLARGQEVAAWVAAKVNLRSAGATSYNHNAAGYRTGQNVRLSAGISARDTGRIGPAPKMLKG